MLRNILMSLLVTASVGAFSQTPPPQYHPNYVWERTSGQGKLWLSWSPERKQGFTEGYLWAYSKGYRQGCLVFDVVRPTRPMKLGEDTSLQKCMERALNYTKGPDFYVAQITAFYEKYPADLDVPIAWLFQAFSDSENKAPEQIHAAWEHHGSP